MELEDRSSFAEQLRQHVEEARAHPPRSLQRQKLLNQIVQEIFNSGRLGHPQQALWPPDLYEDLYNEALQKTLIEICQKIDKYNSEYPVMAWVNFRLNYQFVAVVQDYQRQGITQLPKGNKMAPVRLPSLENLPIAIPNSTEDAPQLQQFLRQDPEGLLQKQRLRDRPDVTFQMLAIAKFIEGKSWPQIAAELEVSAQTLCSFFNRQLRDLIPYFKKYLEA
ncbi:MAG: sigma-70 family RNA polymerase sigma factor [Leptolyngbyaceae cyanobacterium SM1_3_5]|nr:sigma-70 family RNA polymerase sigma factor [Leptolyngbyaceae cyanobacterium SM1_3_5]